MSKKIFITGGAGFIGSAIIKVLAENNELLVYDDLSFGNKRFIDLNKVKFIEGNILNNNALRKAIVDFSPNYVLHLAAIHFIPYCNEHPFESSNINITGTLNVLNICRELPHLEKVFFASTAAVYPIHDEPINETLSAAPSDVYGLSKYAGEEFCKLFYAETNIPTIICRFFNAFGPNETNPHLIPVILEQIKNGNRSIKLGNTKPKRDFIHTYDMAQAVSLLLKNFNTGIDIFNLGRGEEYSVEEVIHAFENAMGEKLEIITDPLKVRKTDRLHLLSNINKLTNFISWQPTISLENGIKTLL